MIKRILSLLTAILLTFAVCFASAPKGYCADEVRFILRADKTQVKAGDVVAYTVSMGKCAHIQAIQVSLDIPSGLLSVSGEAAEGIKETLGAAMADYSDVGEVFASFGTGDYSCDTETLLFTFSCKVGNTAESGKTYTIGASELLAIAPGDEELPAVWDNADAGVTVAGSADTGSSGGGSSGGAGASSGPDASGGAGSSYAPGGEEGSSPVTSDGSQAPAEQQTDENGSVLSPSDPQSGESTVPTVGAASANEAQGGGSAWIFIVVGMAAVIAAAVIAYFLIRNKNKKKEKQDGKEKL